MKEDSEKPQADVSKFLRISRLGIRNERCYLGSRQRLSCAKVSIDFSCRPGHRLWFIDGAMEEASQTSLQRRCDDGDGEAKFKLRRRCRS